MRYPQSMRPRQPARGFQKRSLPKEVLRKDQKLIQIVDSALADVTLRSGHWLACRPGCTQCCIGAFPINQLDALRLRQGLADLEKSAPERGARVRQRAHDSMARLIGRFPRRFH